MELLHSGKVREVYADRCDILLVASGQVSDTKFEFGHAAGDADGSLVLGDEVVTSASSRYWPAEDWERGRPQQSFDKQIVRDWAGGTGWDKTAPGPAIPTGVAELTRDRYIEL